MFNRCVRWSVAAAIAACWVFPAAAQEEPPGLAVNVKFHLKPGKQDEFRDIQARFTAATKEAGTRAFRGVWRNFNNSSEFVVVTPRDNFADFDSSGGGVLSDREFERLRARLADCYDDRDVTIRRVLPDYQITPAETPKMVHTITTTVHPGKNEQFLGLITELFGHMKKAGLPGYGVNRTLYGGSRQTFMSWRPVENMAELDEGGWAGKGFEAMGEEATAKWVEGYQDAIVSTEHDLWVLEEELSFYPEQ